MSVATITRPSQRLADQLRPITIERHYTKHAEGSVLVSFGDTKVICTASVDHGVPKFLRGSGQGWLTAEYGMLPRSTGNRMPRDAVRGRPSGRSSEIQRLIGRCLRASVDLSRLGEYTIAIDCDVIQADGGTRTAAITGGCVALADAINYLRGKQGFKAEPFQHWVAAVSVGIYQGCPVLDLDYAEDSVADTDMNIIMTQSGQFVEVQGTAEKGVFSTQELNAMLELGKQGIAQLVKIQQQAMEDETPK